MRLEELLGREAVTLDQAPVREKLAGRTVLITGAGGSIGSELARQIAACEPRQLTLLERSENGLHNLEIELREKFPALDLKPLLGDITEAGQVAEAFARCRPQSVFHAAAYKHVPMLERHLLQAIRNNIFGTLNVAQAARQAGAEDFLLISSDKAVNPASVMGATKRAAELLITAFPDSLPDDSATRFVAVRFGNVLGSSGSVLPLLLRQIAERRAVTITHPEVARFFMTTTEAVQLVLQAAMIGKGGEIFVLEMGEPVKIADLARRLIHLAGLEPERDLEIRYTGLRPGEKLCEEILADGDEMLPTGHEKICVLVGKSVSASVINDHLAELAEAVRQQDERAGLKALCRMVPEYTPGKEVLASGEANQYPSRSLLTVE